MWDAWRKNKATGRGNATVNSPSRLTSETNPVQNASVINLTDSNRVVNKEKGDIMKDSPTELRRDLNENTKYHIKTLMGRSFPKQKIERLNRWNKGVKK